MIQATREEVVHVFIKLDLPEADRFDVPSGITRKMTVHSLVWEPRSNNSHSIEATAVDDDGCGWTLSLRESDMPAEVRDALVAACFEDDIPNGPKK